MKGGLINFVLSVYFILPAVVFFYACKTKEQADHDGGFEILAEEATGITFNNKLHESDSLNILSYLYYYNGGGVATGDLNNDGLPEIYFSGNQTENRLYLNQGNMRFKDITDEAGVACSGAWNTGITMVDINGDALLDIYVCQVNKPGLSNGSNKLFINNGDLTFTQSAAQFGLNFTGLATHSAFFDYDRDGDLDCYLLNHSIKDPEQFKPAAFTRLITDPVAGDVLLKNENGYFTDVTALARISRSSIGFGLGIDIGDLNRDGWMDIYIGNDFHENDYLYLNKKDGTFEEIISQSTGHTSNFTMGVSISDINNDAWPDIFSLDMKPEDEGIYKQSGGWESFNIYQFKRSFGYHHQSPRNSLQINQGLQGERPVFAELACLLGVEATDWSWSPLVADFNADGHKDIFISNGIERRPNDIDFINYYSNENLSGNTPPLKLIRNMPAGGVDNYLFTYHADSNQYIKTDIPDLQSKVTNGATYSDLDRDGDLDIVCNNLNHPSYILRNNQMVKGFVEIQLKNNTDNTFGIGAQITIHQGDKIQYEVIKAGAGFQSGKENLAYFSTGGLAVDSIVIQWPEGTCQVIRNPNQFFQTISKGNLDTPFACDISGNSISYVSHHVHYENNSADIESEKWVPYSLSTFGPRIATGKKYYYTTGGGSRGRLTGIADGKDYTHLLPDYRLLQGIDENDATFEDFNNDGIEDLFITTGGNVVNTLEGKYRDLIFFGNSNGSFVDRSAMLPQNDRNSSVARPCDYDKDGDIDIFTGTLSRPGHYGWSEPSVIYINDGNGNFSLQELPVWEMVFDAQWIDMNGDKLEDLVVVGHWMPVTIVLNRKTQWDKHMIPSSEGLWFSVYADDLNKDGTPDIIAGNFGKNHPFHADPANPLILFLNDFDLNGQSDPILTYRKEDHRYLYPNLEFFLQQLPGRKKDFVFNRNFAGKTLDEIFSRQQLESATQRMSHIMSSGAFMSNGHQMSWDFIPFNAEMQHSPVWAITDLGNHMFAFGGNFYHMDPNWGRQDAMLLTLLQYSADGSWQKKHSAFRRRSEIRDLVTIGDQLYVASNNDTLISIPLEKLNR